MKHQDRKNALRCAWELPARYNELPPAQVRLGVNCLANWWALAQGKTTVTLPNIASETSVRKFCKDVIMDFSKAA